LTCQSNTVFRGTLTIRALVMGDGVPCYGALEIVGLLLLLLLLLTATFDILKYCIFVLILLNCSLFLAHVISNLMHSSQVLTADNFIITDPFK